MRLLPVSPTFSALMTTMKSPVSTWGVYSGLCLPRSRCAIPARQASERLSCRVDDEPLALDFVWLGGISAHVRPVSVSTREKGANPIRRPEVCQFQTVISGR